MSILVIAGIEFPVPKAIARIKTGTLTALPEVAEKTKLVSQWSHTTFDCTVMDISSRPCHLRLVCKTSTKHEVIVRSMLTSIGLLRWLAHSHDSPLGKEFCGAVMDLSRKTIASRNDTFSGRTKLQVSTTSPPAVNLEYIFTVAIAADGDHSANSQHSQSCAQSDTLRAYT